MLELACEAMLGSIFKLDFKIDQSRLTRPTILDAVVEASYAS